LPAGKSDGEKTIGHPPDTAGHENTLCVFLEQLHYTLTKFICQWLRGADFVHNC